MLNTLPDYDIYMSLFESDKTLRNGIVAVYKEILGFCSQATGIFTKKSKYVPKAALVVARISWRPFDERFKEILESFEYHASQVENAVNIAWMKKDVENCQEERAEREEGKIFREKAEALFPDKRGPIDKTSTLVHSIFLLSPWLTSPQLRYVLL